MHTMSKHYIVALALAWPAVAQAQTLTMPTVEPDDSWTYVNTVEIGSTWRQTHQQVTVDHTSADTIATSNTVVGSTQPPVERLAGRDWSRVRSVNGQQMVVNRPLDFPLSTGKTWVVEYTEDHPNRQHSSEHFRTPYRVVGWESVSVPAGTFRALKIEADGEWSATLAPNLTSSSGARVDAEGALSFAQTSRTMPSTGSGRTYHVFWYAPSVKRWVKSVEEYYSTNGTRTSSYKDELEAYKLGK